jgi:hypothetical protein
MIILNILTSYTWYNPKRTPFSGSIHLVPRNRSAQDLTVEELRQLLIEKRRSERQKRLDHYRRTGRVIMVEPTPMASPMDSHSEPLVLEEEILNSRSSRSKLPR